MTDYLIPFFLGITVGLIAGMLYLEYWNRKEMRKMAIERNKLLLAEIEEILRSEPDPYEPYRGGDDFEESQELLNSYVDDGFDEAKEEAVGWRNDPRRTMYK